MIPISITWAPQVEKCLSSDEKELIATALEEAKGSGLIDRQTARVRVYQTTSRELLRKWPNLLFMATCNRQHEKMPASMVVICHDAGTGWSVQISGSYARLRPR